MNSIRYTTIELMCDFPNCKKSFHYDSRNSNINFYTILRNAGWLVYQSSEEYHYCPEHNDLEYAKMRAKLEHNI